MAKETKFMIEVTTQMYLNHKEGAKTSTLDFVELSLDNYGGSHKGWFKKDRELTPEGTNVMMNVLCSGVTSTIVVGIKNGAYKNREEALAIILGTLTGMLDANGKLQG